MNCQSACETFPALLDRRTSASDHAETRAHLRSCPDCQREFSALSQTLEALDAWAPQPPPELRKNFYARLEEEKNSAVSERTAADRRPSSPGNVWRWILTPALGGAVLLLGFLLGARFGTRPVTVTPDEATRHELALLRQQVNKMGQLVGYSLLQQQQGPVNERLRDVLVAANTNQSTPKVLDDLISALAFDPSANVRLRALEALYAHADNAVVRSGVLAALPREQNPLVQLEMIDFVAAAHDRDATPVLEKMSQTETVDGSVRDAARRVLAQL